MLLPVLGLQQQKKDPGPSRSAVTSGVMQV
jgi:hypothetical protein